MKLGPVLSFTIEKIIYMNFCEVFSPQFMNNVQILENDALGPRTQLLAQRLLVTLLVT